MIGFDYKAEFPWDAKVEFPKFFDFVASKHNEIYLIANSIGAYYSMLSLSDKRIKKAMFVSPIVDMEKLILDMMALANISEQELCKEKIIATSLGEPLSWEYLCYARNNPIKWSVPTSILYGEKDNLTDKETITKFANQIGATLTAMKNAKHWFYTEEETKFLDEWLKKFI